eukprot:363378-Chlamydomonas_euryale.AAC.9
MVTRRVDPPCSCSTDVLEARIEWWKVRSHVHVSRPLVARVRRARRPHSIVQIDRLKPDRPHQATTPGRPL